MSKGSMGKGFKLFDWSSRRFRVTEENNPNMCIDTVSLLKHCYWNLHQGAPNCYYLSLPIISVAYAFTLGTTFVETAVYGLKTTFSWLLNLKDQQTVCIPHTSRPWKYLKSYWWEALFWSYTNWKLSSVNDQYKPNGSTNYSNPLLANIGKKLKYSKYLMRCNTYLPQVE